MTEIQLTQHKRYGSDFYANGSPHKEKGGAFQGQYRLAAFTETNKQGVGSQEDVRLEEGHAMEDDCTHSVPPEPVFHHSKAHPIPDDTTSQASDNNLRTNFREKAQLDEDRIAVEGKSTGVFEDPTTIKCSVELKNGVP